MLNGGKASLRARSAQGSAWVEPQLLPTVMRISVHDHVFSPSACTLLHTFISQDYASIVARSSLLEGALTNNGGTRCFARRQPNTPVEFALESYLGSLAEDDDATQYVEYWTRPTSVRTSSHNLVPNFGISGHLGSPIH